MQLEGRGTEWHLAGVAIGAEAQRVGVAVGHAQATHHRHQRDVHDVVLRPAAVRVTRVVAATGQDVADDAQAVLLREGHRRDRGVQAQHLRADHVGRLVDARDAGQESRDQVVARKVGGRDVGRGQCNFEQCRQRRVGDVVDELAVAAGRTAVELVLVLQADDHFIDQRHAQA